LAWIESHQSLSRHRKTLRAVTLLRIDKHKFLGHLHELWWWALDNVGLDGNLGDLTTEEIEAGAEWDGETGALCQTLQAAGFIDGGDGRTLHDWYDYAGKLLDRREQNAKRMRAARAVHVATTITERAKHVQDTCAARAPATVPNRTQPNPTVPEREQPTVGAKSAAPAPVKAPPPVAKSALKDEHDAARRVLFMALLNGCGYDRNHLTKAEQGELNAAARQLQEAGYKGEDVDAMAGNWISHFEDCTMTPSAIAKHASRLMKVAPLNGRREDIDRGQSSQEHRELTDKYAQFSA
jgi:hypothetical protein